MGMSDDRSPEEIAESIRDFADGVTEPEKWMITVPIDDFNAVKELLNVDESGLGSEYQGIVYCYTDKREYTRVRYKSPIDDVGGELP